MLEKLMRRLFGAKKEELVMLASFSKNPVLVEILNRNPSSKRIKLYEKDFELYLEIAREFNRRDMSRYAGFDYDTPIEQIPL